VTGEPERKSDGKPAVELQGVWVWLGRNLALEDVSLKIECGKFIGLMGPNGGGKTTLIKVIAGLIKPDRGQVHVAGPLPRTVGYVPQEQAIDPDFPVTASDVVETGLYGSLGLIPRVGAKEKRAIVDALALVGMQALAGRRFGEMSGGQKQRIFIARAIVSRPALLLLDEPTTGVDARARDEFYRLLARLRSDLALTVILASHDLEVVPQQVDEIVCINQRVYVHAPPDEVKHTDGFRMAYGCELEFMTHGEHPHRVIGKHEDSGRSDADGGAGGGAGGARADQQRGPEGKESANDAR
jgi:zinc transport system ATP-binding protein